MEQKKRTTRDSHINLIILPDWAAKSRKYRFPRSFIAVLMVLLALSLLATVAFSVRYVHLATEARRAEQLAQRVAQQEQLLDDLQLQVDLMETEMSQLAEVDQHVRTALESEFPDAYRSILAAGSDELTRRDQIASEFLAAGPEDAATATIEPRQRDTSSDEMDAGIASLEARVSRLLTEAQVRLASFTQLRSEVGAYLSEDENEPHLWPVKGAYITSDYGWRTSPTTGAWEFHRGIDLAAPTGTPVVATAAGTVAFAGRRHFYGKVVEVRHSEELTSVYGHCSEILVRVGQRVSAGEVIALVGSTGRSTGPHVHYEVRRDDQPINPWSFLSRDGERR